MDLPIRKRTRLKGYNYSTPGEYFVTICTSQKMHLFGEIKNAEMHLSIPPKKQFGNHPSMIT